MKYHYAVYNIWLIVIALLLPSHMVSAEEKTILHGELAVPLKNLSYLGRGYDITTLDPILLGNSVDHFPKGAVIEIDSSNTKPIPDGSAEIPKGTEYAPLSGGISRAESHELFTSYDFQQEFSANIEVSVGLPGVFSASQSVSYENFKQVTKTHEMMQIITERVALIHALSLLKDYPPEKLKVAERFAAQVAKLPHDKTAKSFAAYRQFIEDFGTHYADRIIFGGRVIQRINLTGETYYELKSHKIDIGGKAEGILKGIELGGSSNQSYSQKHIFEKRSKDRVESAQFSGGRPKSNFDDWVDSLDKDPGPVKMKLSPIYDVLTKEFFPNDPHIQAKQKLLKVAIDSYVKNNGDYFGPLNIRYAEGFERVWWDKGSGGRHDGAYYRPIAPYGYHILGHYGQRGYGKPHGKVIVVKAIDGMQGSSTALKHPRGYTKIWGDHGSGANEDGAFWWPIPQPGYTCLGVVATQGYREPSTDEVMCVRNDLVVSAKAGNWIWNDKNTGANRDFGSWEIVPLNPYEGMKLGLFFAQASHSTPYSGNFYTLKTSSKKPATITGWAGDLELPPPVYVYPLDISYTTRFRQVWWDKGSGGHYDGAYYKPIAPSGYYILGHYGQGNYHSPSGKVVVVKIKDGIPDSENPPLKRPKDYQKIWGDHGSGAKQDGAFWLPIPDWGYKCLGTVATRGYTKPSRNEIMCVRDDLVVPARVGGRIWIDKGTGANRDFGSWYIVPSSLKGINSGLFAAHASHRIPSSSGLYTLMQYH
jgi:hypothetical protein